MSIKKEVDKMSSKYTIFGAQGVLPNFCRFCGKKIIQGKATPEGYDERDGKKIYSVQLHCVDASGKDINRGGAGGNFVPTHTVVHRNLKKRNQK